MGQSRATMLLAGLVVGLLAAGTAWAEPIKPEPIEPPTTDETLIDPFWEGELPPGDETEEDSGAGIIDLTEELPTEEPNPDEILYYLMNLPPEGEEGPQDGEYIPLSAQSGVHETPEPGSLALGGLGLLSLLGYGCRRRQA
ncbi:MAG: PEP-CTERM sorting domain-containing protein [Planctomycetia bacterium]|nr:PEP-CTERM sorting domain-containing protein [Planctomycetia bacterium]